MFQHVARFELPVSVGGDRGDSLETLVAFVTGYTVGATHGGELLLFDRTPFQLRGRWPFAEAARRGAPPLERARLDPVAVLYGGRMLFLLCGYQEGQPSFLGVPVVFDPTRTPAFATLTGRWGKPFPLGRVTARRVHDLPDGRFGLTTETRVSAMFHVESDETVDGACLLDIARGSIREIASLPSNARPHDSGEFFALGFGISISDEQLFGPPPWGSGANVEFADGTITVTPTTNASRAA